LIIAEIGQNHNGSMSLAKELIHAAMECGASIAKFQLFDAARLFPKDNNPWYEYNLSTELSYDQAEELSDYCKLIGIEFMASAFDSQRIDWLEKLGVRRHKLASRSIHDTELAGRMVATNKEVIVSLGFWKSESLPNFSDNAKIKFLHCVSQYPAPYNSIHLSQVDFNKIAGLSDHCIGISASIAAISRGATIIEKHFTLDKSMYGPDHSCSVEPQELALLVKLFSEIRLCL
jgi:sialic acid synthase SpsE